MNRSKAVVAVLLAAAVFGAFAGSADEAAKPKKRVSAGMLEKPDSQKGFIAIVNRQKRLSEKDLAAAVKVIEDQTRCKVVVGSADGAGVAVEVVDNETAPTLAAYPDDYRATVNVGKLAAGLKGDALEKFFVLRCQRAILRGFCYACGAGGTEYPDNVLAIGKISDYDLIQGLFIPGDAAFACQRRMKKVGVTQKLFVPYGRACFEGWAPAPTNEVQKKIWDSVRERKEKGPTNPIKIKPPKK